MGESVAACNVCLSQMACSETKIAEKRTGMADGADKTDDYGKGHRGRLRDRLLNSGGDTLLDHELVEYLLSLVIPRRDTKPLAKQLIAQYGSLSALFTADAESLTRQAGMGESSAAAIKIVQAAALRMLSEPVRELAVVARLSTRRYGAFNHRARPRAVS